MTPSPRLIPNRRGFLASASASVFAVPSLLAADPTRTPAQTEGPFYPDRLPLDTDNDLLILNDGKTAALGDITHLTGKILDAKGNPLSGAVVEIWQCDANGVYLHTGDSGKKQDKQDKNFQGFGRFTTDKTGAYYFRTIKPVPYPGRCPHIHVKVKKDRKELLVTQMYIAGDERNLKDGIYMGVKDKKERESITIEFAPIKGAKNGELAANFDIVLGFTPKVD